KAAAIRSFFLPTAACRCLLISALANARASAVLIKSYLKNNIIVKPAVCDRVCPRLLPETRS
ncbi:MAG TPA: hypothetical protein VK892_23335, partial [Pyrinomonadaceae bacterium]|nr:hypothetical protein [Pyrinomonadaceae bacterium]